MNKFIMLLLVASLFTISGCSKTNIHVQQSSNTGQVEKYDRAQHFFVWGIAQQRTVDAASICGGADKVARVETQKTAVNGLLDLLTGGLYQPRQARVFCKL